MHAVRHAMRDWDEDWIEEWEERAAIMEHDGKMQREQAELMAYIRVCRLKGDRPNPAVVQVHLF